MIHFEIERKQRWSEGWQLNKGVCETDISGNEVHLRDKLKCKKSVILNASDCQNTNIGQL